MDYPVDYPMEHPHIIDNYYAGIDGGMTDKLSQLVERLDRIEDYMASHFA